MSISPNVPTPQESYAYESPGTPRWITILLVLLIAGLGGLGYLGYNAQTKISQTAAVPRAIWTSRADASESDIVSTAARK